LPAMADRKMMMASNSRMGTKMASVQKHYASMSQIILKFGGDGTLNYFYAKLTGLPLRKLKS